METEKLNKIVEISRDACYDLKLVLSSGNTDSDDMDEAVDTVVKAILKGIEVANSSPVDVSKKTIEYHMERSGKIASAIGYFDSMAKRRTDNAIYYRSIGNEKICQLFTHKADIALRAKKRMEDLYLKHSQTLTLK